jgi:hypothetical protein
MNTANTFHAVVGIDRDLFFLLDLQQGRVLFHNLPQSVIRAGH